MYKIIAVDDELLSLKRFEHIIAKEARVELVNSFTDSKEALEYVKQNDIDIAFLDIEMPELNGLELAERIGEIDPYVNIIFVTAFDQYALDAFKAHAIGYLLKPLDIRELSIQLDKIDLTYKPRQKRDKHLIGASSDATKLIVKCLGQFTCYPVNNPDNPISFRTTKTAELFAFLIHHYKSPVTKYFILDSLFPDMDYEKSNKLFYVSCSYLRNAFTKYDITEILIRDNDSYRINSSIINCDYINFMNSYEKLNSLSLTELKDTAKLYNGEYLLGRNYEWAFETKPYIDNLYETILFKYTDILIDNGNIDDAITELERFLTIDPLRESTITKLISILINNNMREKALSVYSSYEKKLLEQLDAVPSSSLKKLIM